MKKGIDAAISAVVVATGIASVATQLLAIREYLSLFHGNEYVIALILFSWLVLGGIGTLLVRVTARIGLRPSIGLLCGASLLLTVLSSHQILGIRFLRQLLFIPGAAIGFYPTLAFVALTLAPYALLVGYLLPLSLMVVRETKPDYVTTRIYVLDNLGDVTGGALFSFLVVALLTPMWTALLAHLTLIMALVWLVRCHGRKISLWLIASAAALAILTIAVVIEPVSLRPYRGELVDYRETRYGRVTLHRDHEQLTLFSDGLPQTSSQDVTSAEESVHYALAQLPQVRRVLLIGAEAGMVAEIEKYAPEIIDYVELNPVVAKMQTDHGLIRGASNLTVHHLDGRQFLNQAGAAYDAVLVNLSDPETFQPNRYYTSGFFDLAARRLSDQGVLCFSTSGIDNYVSEIQRMKLSMLYRTARESFQNVLLLPAGRGFFLCRQLPLSTRIPEMLAQKGIETRYVQRYYRGNLSDNRISQLNELLDPAAPRNSDLSPRLMGMMFSQWFKRFGATPQPFLASIAVLTLLYLLWLRAETLVLFSTGFAVMGSEIVVIFAFQIFFGYVYFQIGLIVTAFLAGLIPGAWLGQRWCRRGRRLVVGSDGLLLILLLGMIPILHGFGNRLPAASFLAFGFVLAMICGFQFAVIIYILGDSAPSAANAFSADLVGAAAGALYVSVLLLPYGGLTGAVAGIAAVKLISLGVFGLRQKARAA